MNKEQTVNEFLDALYKSNHNRVNGDSAACDLFGAESPFRIICTKCGGTKIEIIGSQGIDYGGYTGYCPGSTVIKCLKCGAAISAYQ